MYIRNLSHLLELSRAMLSSKTSPGPKQDSATG